MNDQLLIALRKLSATKKSITVFVAILATVVLALSVLEYSYFRIRHPKSIELEGIPGNFLRRTDGSHMDTEGRPLFRNIKWLSNSSKKILLWNMPGSVSYPKRLNQEKCGHCVMTTDKGQFNESDGVVFNFRGMTRPEQFPQRSDKNQQQVYVWLCRESPRTTRDNYNLNLSKLDNIFNWTMTYRLDSDVFFPYSEMLHRHHDERWSSLSEGNGSGIPPAYVDMHYFDVDELIARKRHMVAWVVGNCEGTVGAKVRMGLVKLLTKGGLSVDRFGKCFEGVEFPPYRSEEAHERLSEYKFYLAFENTFGCRDYVTYKFWKNALYSGAVPVVWGPKKADVLRLAPDGSFIHIEDFTSLNHLIYYLKYLNLNDTAYREYFAWREKEIAVNKIPLSFRTADRKMSDWIFSTDEAFGYCKLCRMLHEGDRVKWKTIRSLDHWWYGNEDPTCLK